jgi:hypothetical protein
MTIRTWAAVILSARIVPGAWVTEGYESFRKGRFDSSGVNLYVSRNGTVQTVHRFDVNNDGYPDLIFNNTHDLAYTVPSFAYEFQHGSRKNPALTEFPGSGAVRVLAADLNSDGFPELVVARGFDNTTRFDNSWIYWGSRDGWVEQFHSEFPTPYVQDVCSGDLNHDGFTDVVLVGSHEGDLGGNTGSYIYWGSSTGLSREHRSELPTHGAIGCAIGDLNRDGYLDLVFANMDPGGMQILYGSPQGFDLKHQTSWAVADPRFPMLADANRDGYLDVLVPSVKRGLLIYYGSASGFAAERFDRLDGTVTVSQQVADLNGDGYLDIIVCNLMDDAKAMYHGIHSFIYWGSAQGYSSTRRSELPSSGAHHAVVADFNRDGHLDIFISNYQSEFTRSLDSYVYWGDAKGSYSPARRFALHNESAAGVVAADLNGDGWVDLAVSNHVQNGDHHTRSLIFWNQAGTFNQANTISLQTVGPHMMTGVDYGNIYTRKSDETYDSEPWDAGVNVAASALSWEGSTLFGSRLTFDIRSSESREGLAASAWQAISGPGPVRKIAISSQTAGRWWQYRVHFLGGQAAWPTLRKVDVEFARR